VHTEKIDDVQVLDTFVLSSEEEDYYLYERLTERMRFELPELITSKLISVS
jgi:hypothetical protein